MSATVLPVQFELVLPQYADLPYVFGWEVDGGAVDLGLGYTAKMDFRASATSPDPPAVSLASGAGITLNFQALGNILVYVTKANTDTLLAAIPGLVGVCTLMLYASGVPIRFGDGRWRISRGGTPP